MFSSSRARPLLVSLALILGISVVSPLAAADPVSDLVRASGYVFRGTVLATGRATMPGVPVDAGTAVVRVEHVLFTPPGLDDFTGRSITVQLRDPGQPPVGQSTAFFTRTSIFGASLMVREVGSLPVAGADDSVLAAQVAAAERNLADEALRRRLDSARWVVVGRVTSAAPAAVPARETPEVTEHDPDWWIARVEVRSVAKGWGWPGELAALFPHSNDVAYHQNPKLSAGEERILILHDAPIAVRARGLAGLTALDPLDVQSLDQLARIQALLAATTGGAR